jgi:hypothetical protein
MKHLDRVKRPSAVITTAPPPKVQHHDRKGPPMGAQVIVIGDLIVAQRDLIARRKFSYADDPEIRIVGDEQLAAFIDWFELIQPELSCMPKGSIEHIRGTMWGLIKRVFTGATHIERLEATDCLIFTEEAYQRLTATDFPEGKIQEPNRSQEPSGDNLLFALMHICNLPPFIFTLKDGGLEDLPIPAA